MPFWLDLWRILEDAIITLPSFRTAFMLEVLLWYLKYILYSIDSSLGFGSKNMFIKVSGKNAFIMHMFKDMDVLPNCCRKSRNIWKEIIRTLAKQYLNLSKETHLLSSLNLSFLFLVIYSLTKNTFSSYSLTASYKDTHLLSFQAQMALAELLNISFSGIPRF